MLRPFRGNGYALQSNIFASITKNNGPIWSQKQHFPKSARDHRAMTIPKQKVETTKVSVRFSKQLHDELKAAADANNWSVNAEINYRLRMEGSASKLDTLLREVAELKALLRKQQNS